MTAQGTYGTLPEADLVAAGDAAYALAGLAPEALNLPGRDSDAVRLTKLGGWLRAAEPPAPTPFAELRQSSGFTLES